MPDQVQFGDKNKDKKVWGYEIYKLKIWSIVYWGLFFLIQSLLKTGFFSYVTIFLF